MSFLYQNSNPATNYSLKKWVGSEEDYCKILSRSCTLYVGNLSFCTTEEQIWELFSTAGEVKRVIMGLNRNTATPCGFCFIEYFTHQTAQIAVTSLNNTYIDSRIIRADWDTGFVEGRQYGRGQSGGQIRDDYRMNYDQDRDKVSLFKSSPPPPPPPQAVHRPPPVQEFAPYSTEHRYNRMEDSYGMQPPQVGYREPHTPFYQNDRKADAFFNNRGQFNMAPSQHYQAGRSPPRHSRHSDVHGHRSQGGRVGKKVVDDYSKKYRDYHEDSQGVGAVDEFGRDIPINKKLRH